MRLDDDADVRRCAPRLLRFARHVGAAIQGLSAADFAEDVHACPMRWEVINKIDLSRFCKLVTREHPHDHGGLLRWRLRPRDVETVGDLPAIVAALVAECCASRSILIRSYVRKKSIRYRFVIENDGHAHVGRIDFVGRAIERALREGRKRVGNNRRLIADLRRRAGTSTQKRTELQRRRR